MLSTLLLGCFLKMFYSIPFIYWVVGITDVFWLAAKSVCSKYFLLHCDLLFTFLSVSLMSTCWEVVLCTVYSDVDFYAQTSRCSPGDGAVRHLQTQCYIKFVFHLLWLVNNELTSQGARQKRIEQDFWSESEVPEKVKKRSMRRCGETIGKWPWGVTMSRLPRESPWGHAWTRASQGETRICGPGSHGWETGSLRGLKKLRTRPA